MQLALEMLTGCDDIPLPALATPGSAGFDVCAAVPFDTVLEPGLRILVPLGFRMALPPGYEAQLRPRSGLALKHGIEIPNSPGTIDSDYRDPVGVILKNGGSAPFTITRGMRVAQMVIATVATHNFTITATTVTRDTARLGGFGSTGTAALEQVA